MRKIVIFAWILVILIAIALTVISAQASGDDVMSVIDCEAGAQVIDIGEGRIRIVGHCEGYEYGRHDTPPQRIPDGTTPTQPEPDDGGAYPEPEIEPEPYPDMQRDMTWCEYMWSNGFECEE